MMKLSHAIAFSVFSTGLLCAATVPCISATAAIFVTNFSGTGTMNGCTIVSSGGTTVLFNGFSFIHLSSGPTTGGGDTQINLNPVPGSSVGFDIMPIGPFSAGATGTNDVQLGFIATVIAGPQLINDLFLSMTGTAGAAIPGGLPGTDTLTETYCRGGSVPPGSCPAGQGGPQTAILTITPTSGPTVTTNPTFAPTIALSLIKDIQVGLPQGQSTGASSVSDVQNLVSLTAVPEPSTAWLAAIGCVLVGFRVRRRPKQN